MIYKKIVKSFAVALILALTFTACCDNSQKETKEVVIDKENVVKAVLNVDGMTCAGCEMAIQGNVEKMAGVLSVKASHTDKTTVIEYDKTQTNTKEIEKVISETGYKIFQESEKEALKEVPGTMKCAAGKCGAGKCGSTE